MRASAAVTVACHNYIGTPGEKSPEEEMPATLLEERGRPCALVIVLVGVGEPGEPEKKEQDAGVVWLWTS